MKKIIVILVLLFIIIISSIYALFLNNKMQKRALDNYNREYNEYLNKTIYGSELATLINRAINQNENNKIQKDNKKHYIENDENSIKIEIKMLITEKTYPMEEIYNNNTEEFVKYFNTEKFKCTKIEYHNKTGKVSKLFLEQVEE